MQSVLRITSYNVCYTKLLRYDSQIQSAAITSLPVIIETKEAVLTNTLPDELSDDSILLIETSYPSLVAAIDGIV